MSIQRFCGLCLMAALAACTGSSSDEDGGTSSSSSSGGTGSSSSGGGSSSSLPASTSASMASSAAGSASSDNGSSTQSGATTSSGPSSSESAAGASSGAVSNATSSVGASSSNDSGSQSGGASSAGGTSAGASSYGSSSGGAAPQAVTGGETCDAAVSLGAGQFRVDTTASQNDISDAQGACGVATTNLGRDQVFAVEVPAGTVVRARFLEGAAFSGARLSIITSCANTATSCERLSPTEVTWYNAAAASQTVYLVVDGFLANDAGTADLEVAFIAPGSLAQGDLCTNAIVVSGPGTYTGDTAAFHNLYDGFGGACIQYNVRRFGGGPDVVYAIDVNAGATLTATAAASGGWDSVVAIIDDCSEPVNSCRSYGDEPPTATVTNTTGATVRYYVVVDGFWGTARGASPLTLGIAN